LLYIELTIKQAPEKLCQVVEGFHFPLDEVLAICLKNKHFYGAAYIKFRLGMKKEAMKDYMQILQTELNRFIKSTSKTEREQAAINAEFAFHRVMLVCVQSVKDEDNKGVKKFKEFLLFLVELYTDISEQLEQFYLVSRKHLSQEQIELDYLSLHELKRWIRENYIFELFSVMFRTIDQEANEMIRDEAFIRSLDL
jgi:hypothetical protein